MKSGSGKFLVLLGMVPRRYLRCALRTVGLMLLALIILIAVTKAGGFSDRFHRVRQVAFDDDGEGRRRHGDQQDNMGLVEKSFAINSRRKALIGDRGKSAEDGASRSRKKRKPHKSKAAAVAAAAASTAPDTGSNDIRVRALDISVNDQYTVKGLYMQEEKEAYIPFKFVRKYFDIYGDLKSKPGSDGPTRLAFSHAYGKPFSPRASYKHTASGPFVNFGGFNVAGRERVLYVDENDVPVSTQWDPKGYHFATQISQYGLQHYSALASSNASAAVVWILETGRPLKSDAWEVNERIGNRLKQLQDAQLGHVVVDFCTEIASGQLTASRGIRHTVARTTGSGNSFRAVLARIKMTGAAMALSFHVLMSDKKVYTLVYDTTATRTLEVKGETMRYRLLAEKGVWRTFARDLQNDLQRGVVFLIRNEESTKPQREVASASVKLVRVQLVVLHGCGHVANLSVRSEAHLPMAMAAVNWLVKNQNQTTGGWPTNALRTLKPDLALQPGWLSAMVQGQAMSLLARVYSATKDKKYLNAALMATRPFHKLAKEGGVKAVFLKEYTWYEEYPTQPSSFVLNGFIFSLLGLHDLAEVASSARVQSDAEQLYLDGVRSLKALIMLYDTGVGTIYDLRHFSIPMFPPNRARWDYHVTHINLVTAMATIDDHPVFKTLRERWLGYMVGKATKHN